MLLGLMSVNSSTSFVSNYAVFLELRIRLWGDSTTVNPVSGMTSGDPLQDAQKNLLGL